PREFNLQAGVGQAALPPQSTSAHRHWGEKAEMPASPSNSTDYRLKEGKSLTVRNITQGGIRDEALHPTELWRELQGSLPFLRTGPWRKDYVHDEPRRGAGSRPGTHWLSGRHHSRQDGNRGDGVDRK